jgi:hypothetical protein
MDKEGTKVIKEQSKKEKEEAKKMRKTYSQSTTNRTTQKLVEKRHRVDFNQAWLTLVIREACENFTRYSKLVTECIH